MYTLYDMPQPSTTMNTQLLERELNELDRLLHRIKEQLRTPQESGVRLSHWRAIRGILKGKLTEDPLAYQRRIRAESERS